eukprot:3969180-Pleurochrysis_carterae.AAC.1
MGADMELEVRRWFLGRESRRRSDLADVGELVKAGVLALRARLGVLLASEAGIYNHDGAFLGTVHAMVEAKKAACND